MKLATMINNNRHYNDDDSLWNKLHDINCIEYNRNI